MTVNNDGHPLTGWPFVVVSPFPPPCVIPGQRPPAGTERAARALTSRREPQMRLAGTIIHLFIFITIQTMATQQSEAPVSDFGQIKKPLEISGFIIVGSNSLQSVAFFHFPMQNFEKISPRRSEVVISPVMVPRASRLRRRSAAIRSVGRSESSPRRVSSSASAAVRSAS